MHILNGIITIQYDEGELSQADPGKMVCVETANHPENFLKVNNSNNNNNDKKILVLPHLLPSSWYFPPQVYPLLSSSSEKRIWAFYLTGYSLKLSQQQDAFPIRGRGVPAGKRTELPESSPGGSQRGTSAGG